MVIATIILITKNVQKRERALPTEAKNASAITTILRFSHKNHMKIKVWTGLWKSVVQPASHSGCSQD